VFQFNSKVMGITDKDVIHRLLHPDVFRKLRLNSVQLDGNVLRCIPQQGTAYDVIPVITLNGGIERREYVLGSGKLVISRDGLEMLCEVFFQHDAASPERKVLRCALRDRQLDGTPQASPLSAFPVTHEATNKLPHPDFKVAELSIYCYDPERYLPPSEMLDFIMGVDDYIYKSFEPITFFRLWSKAFDSSNMAPWQPAPPLKGVAQHFVEAAGIVLTEVGYHRMDAVAGWYNAVCFFVEKMNFQFTYGEHKAAFDALQNSLHQMDVRLGRRLNLREQAWVVALQSIPAQFIPPQLSLGCRWINTPTYTDYCCRVHRDLNPFPADPRMSRIVLPSAFTPAPPVAADSTSLPKA
jgi:hypothetical protein